MKKMKAITGIGGTTPSSPVPLKSHRLPNLGSYFNNNNTLDLRKLSSKPI